MKMNKLLTTVAVAGMMLTALPVEVSANSDRCELYASHSPIISARPGGTKDAHMTINGNELTFKAFDAITDEFATCVYTFKAGDDVQIMLSYQSYDSGEKKYLNDGYYIDAEVTKVNFREYTVKVSDDTLKLINAINTKKDWFHYNKNGTYTGYDVTLSNEFEPLDRCDTSPDYDFCYHREEDVYNFDSKYTKLGLTRPTTQNKEESTVTPEVTPSEPTVSPTPTEPTTPIVKPTTGLDLSAYSAMNMNVYQNSRVTKMVGNANGTLTVSGYMFNDANCNKANSLYREIIFVNANDTSTTKAYRQEVKSEYNPWLNKNMTATQNGKYDLSYANYSVTVNPKAMLNYAKTSTTAMAKGEYLAYMRISDGKTSYLFPLKDMVLSDGSTMEAAGTLPKGFKVNDPTERTLSYVVE